MKNTRRFIALILSLLLLCSATSVSASAISLNTSPSTASFDVSSIMSIFQKLFSFFNSSNEQSDIPYTVNASGEIFENGKYFSSSHASTIAKMTNGDLVAAWFGGSGEGDDDVRIWYAIYSDGAWSVPTAIPSDENVAHWNPVLQTTLLGVRLYYKFGTDTKNWVTKYVETFNFGETFTAPKELVEGDTTGGRGPVKNKCLLTKSGLLIAPASSEQGTWTAFFDYSRDGGRTWTKTANIVAKNSRGKAVEMIQPALWQDLDGVVHAMFRTKSSAVYRADSTDGGITWGEAYETSLPNNNSGIDCVMTDNGWLWLAYNPLKLNGLRYKLRLSVSKDNGQTWEDVVDLENSALIFNEYSYPAIIASGNSIYITYTYKREQIKYYFFTFEG